MEANILNIVTWLGPTLIAGAAAWGGTRQALNGTRERVRNIETKLDTHISDDHEVQTKMVEGLTRVDQKLDSFIQHKG